eukprot:1785-Heterococcus_DN1.PRE.14
MHWCTANSCSMQQRPTLLGEGVKRYDTEVVLYNRYWMYILAQAQWAEGKTGIYLSTSVKFLNSSPFPMKLSLIACCIAAAACAQGMLVGATGVDSLGSPELFEASEYMAPTDHCCCLRAATLP